MMFDYSLGATIYNQTLVTRVEGADPQCNADKRVFYSRWSQVGDHTKYKDIADKSIPDVTSRFIRDEYFLNMKSLIYPLLPAGFVSKIVFEPSTGGILMNDIWNYPFIARNA